MKCAVASVALVLGIGALAPGARGHAATPGANGGVPPDANTSDPAAPFYVDLSFLDFATVPPTRDPSNPHYPRATELADGVLPPLAKSGNFIIGPTHTPAAETATQPGVPAGRVVVFTMRSADGDLYRPGLVRDEAQWNAAIRSAGVAPGDPSNLLITSSHPGTWTRTVSVYVPRQHRAGSLAPFIVLGDGGGGLDRTVFTTLDNLIAAHRIPAIVAVSIGNGGQDAQGSQRGFEYDTVSGTYAEWVEREVLPLVERNAGVRLTHDPDGRATMGLSSSAAAAFSMAWFHPELYHRVLGYSPTMVNQQWPHNPAVRGGAWEYHSAWPGPATPAVAANGTAARVAGDAELGMPLIPQTPRKPIRYWFEVGDRDLFYPIASMADGMHDWVLANENMARVLAGRDYPYQFVFARNASHVDWPTLLQTLPAALEWVWQGYPTGP